ncbi:VPA1262 family N-terminal domain-containing protein [Pseudomonas alloputida]|uniref:VPA1262 family N-terminal domain-containing protein n=1 Tax=Pseudomonas alloputida TaxID=1940621 RepID=UPI0038700CF2
MSVQEAIRWYRSASEELRTPVPIYDVRDGADGEPLFAGRLSDFPAWPLLGVPMESEELTTKSERSPIPFRNQGIIRYSRRISDGQEWPNFLDPNGQDRHSQEAFKFLEHTMHVDFREYPEYLGGMALAVPDPDVHSIRQFINPNEDGSESLYFHLKPHQGRKLQDFSLTSLEGQRGMLTSAETVAVPEDGLVVIDRPSSIHVSGLILSHKERGVLLQTPMRPFMRQMNMTTEVVEQRVKVIAPETDKKKSPAHEYFAEKKSLASSSTWGDALNTKDAFTRLLDAKNERLLNHSARLYEQTWFTADQRKAALDHIREKLRHARSNIFIADPYFGANQIFQYLLAVERDDVRINILTSSSVFKSFKEASADPQADVGGGSVDTYQTMLGNLEKFQGSHKNSIEIKVANSESSLFHDRFLAVDGRVWMLGSSLNSIGVRPTLIMRVPHGEKILSHLIALYENSTSLINFQPPARELRNQCEHCGRDSAAATRVQEAECEPDEQVVKDMGPQGAQDVTNG